MAGDLTASEGVVKVVFGIENIMIAERYAVAETRRGSGASIERQHLRSVETFWR